MTPPPSHYSPIEALLDWAGQCKAMGRVDIAVYVMQLTTAKARRAPGKQKRKVFLGKVKGRRSAEFWIADELLRGEKET